MKEALIEKIIKIGIKEECDKEEYLKLLPNSPEFTGDEEIFKLKDELDLEHLSKLDLENLLKGLHQIELKHREVTGSDSGFGSATPTYHIIKKIVDDPELKDSFEKVPKSAVTHIRVRGGNYFFEANKGKRSKKEIWKISLWMSKFQLNRIKSQDSDVYDLYDFRGKRISVGLSKEHAEKYKKSSYYSLKRIPKKEAIERSEEILEKFKEKFKKESDEVL